LAFKWQTRSDAFHSQYAAQIWSFARWVASGTSVPVNNPSLIVAERRSSCLHRPGDDARFDGGGSGNLAAANDDSSAMIGDAAPQSAIHLLAHGE
jgi:hypothetical protein